MNALIEFLNLAGDRFAGFALPMLWQCTAVILAVWILDALLRRRASATFRYTLSLLILVKFLLPPTFALPTSPFYWHTPAAQVEETAGPAVEAGNWHSEAAAYVATAPSRSVSSPLPAVLIEPQVPLTKAGLALLIALGGQAILIVFLLFRLGQIHQLVRLATAAPPELEQLLSDCCRQLSLRPAVEIKLTSQSMSPALCGLWRPVILLPDHLYQSLDENQLRSVLLHELVHHRRRDVWLNWLQTILQVLYWWHPLSWLANGHIRQVREQAVDETVAATLQEESDSYASALVIVARQCLSRPMTSLGLVGIIESSKALKDRIQHLLEAGPQQPSRFGFASLFFLLVLSVTVLPMAKAQSKTVNSPVAISRTIPLSVLFYEIPETELLSLSLRQPDQRTGNVSVWSFNHLELETVLRRARTNASFRGFTQTDVVGAKAIGGQFTYTLDPARTKESAFESSLKPAKNGMQLAVHAHTQMKAADAPKETVRRPVVYSGLYQTFDFVPQTIAGGYHLTGHWQVGKNGYESGLKLPVHANGGTLAVGARDETTGRRPVILMLTSEPFLKLDWHDWSIAAVEKARREHQIVLVNFEAAWAVSSQVNLERSLNTKNVRDQLQRLGGIALRADYTQENAAIKAELARHGRVGVPLTLIYPRLPNAAPIVLTESFTETDVLKALTNAARTEITAEAPRFRLIATAYEFPASAFQALAAGPKSPGASGKFSTAVMPLTRKETLMAAIHATNARELDNFNVTATNGVLARMHKGGTITVNDNRSAAKRIEKGVIIEATPRLRPDQRMVELDVSIAHRKALSAGGKTSDPLLEIQSTMAATWLGTNQLMLIATPQETQTMEGSLVASQEPVRSENVLLVLLQVEQLNP